MGLNPSETFSDGTAAHLGRPFVPHALDDRKRDKVWGSAEKARCAVDPRNTDELELKMFDSLLRAADYRGG